MHLLTCGREGADGDQEKEAHHEDCTEHLRIWIWPLGIRIRSEREACDRSFVGGWIVPRLCTKMKACKLFGNETTIAVGGETQT